MIDRKGILSYLVLTFGITYAIEIPLILSGVRWDETTNLASRYYIWGVMWAPALSAIITARFITREGMSGMGLRFGPWRAYLIPMLAIPLCFVLIYAITWGLGLGAPDWGMTYLLGMARQAGADMTTAPSPGVLIAGLFIGSLLPATLLNGLFGFGEELGWRGYLLPKLMPLGKLKAYLLIGVIWGLWHAPLIVTGFNYGRTSPLLALVVFMGLTTVLGIYLNEAALRTGSSILPGWLHGLFNSQRLGLWGMLFPVIQPVLGGPVGLVGIVILSAVGLVALRRPAWLGLAGPKPAAEQGVPRVAPA